MMKKMLLTSLVILILFSAKSQIAKKNWLLGGAFGYNTGSNNYSSQSNANVTPRIAYAIGHNSVVGLKGSFSYGQSKDTLGNKNTDQNFSSNIFWRKYSIIKNKLGWYVETSAGLSKGTSHADRVNPSADYKTTTKGYNIAVTPGVFYIAGPGILLNADFAGLGYSHISSKSYAGEFKSDNFSVNFLNYFSFGVDFIL